MLPVVALIVKCDYRKDTCTDTQTDGRQTDAGQKDPYKLLC